MKMVDEMVQSSASSSVDDSSSVSEWCIETPSGLPESNYRRLEFNTGEVYVGCVDVATGKLHGVGVLTHVDESTYRGEFRMGQKHGLGVTLFANGDKHVGEYLENVYHGHGTYTKGDGSVTYTGGFAKGQFDGQGTLQYTTKGMTFRGSFSLGEKVSGVMIFADGRTKRVGASDPPKSPVSAVSLFSTSDHETDDTGSEEAKETYPISRTMWTKPEEECSRRPTDVKRGSRGPATKSGLFTFPQRKPESNPNVSPGLRGFLTRSRSFHRQKPAT